MNGNIRNDGYITTYPTVLRGEAISLTASASLVAVGNCHRNAAPNMTNVLVQQLAVEASFSGDPEMVMQAVALDSLTANVPINETEAWWLKCWRPRQNIYPSCGQKLRSVPLITVPANGRQPVLLDPPCHSQSLWRWQGMIRQQRD